MIIMWEFFWKYFFYLKNESCTIKLDDYWIPPGWHLFSGGLGRVIIYLHTPCFFSLAGSVYYASYFSVTVVGMAGPS